MFKKYTNIHENNMQWKYSGIQLGSNSSLLCVTDYYEDKACIADG
jgi:hypothetical protein